MPLLYATESQSNINEIITEAGGRPGMGVLGGRSPPQEELTIMGANYYEPVVTGAPLSNRGPFLIGREPHRNVTKFDFPEMGLPGVEIVTRPRRSILHATEPSHLPCDAKI